MRSAACCERLGRGEEAVARLQRGGVAGGRGEPPGSLVLRERGERVVRGRARVEEKVVAREDERATEAAGVGEAGVEPRAHRHAVHDDDAGGGDRRRHVGVAPPERAARDAARGERVAEMGHAVAKGRAVGAGEEEDRSDLRDGRPARSWRSARTLASSRWTLASSRWTLASSRWTLASSR